MKTFRKAKIIYFDSIAKIVTIFLLNIISVVKNDMTASCLHVKLTRYKHSFDCDAGWEGYS